MTNGGTQKYISDTLYHFVGRGAGTDDEQYEILKIILASGQLLFDPSGNFPDAVKPFDIDLFHSLGEISRIPAICFCDIPIDSISIHIQKYSKFGIGFDKQTLCTKGVRPVWYIPKNSYSAIVTSENIEIRFPIELEKILRATSLIIDKLTKGTDIANPPNKLTEDEDLQKSLELLHSGHFFILAELAWFFKFYDSNLSDDHLDNYYFEREWRKVNGNLSFSFKDINCIVLPSKKYNGDLIREFPDLKDKIKLISN